MCVRARVCESVCVCERERVCDFITLGWGQQSSLAFKETCTKIDRFKKGVFYTTIEKF